MKAKYLICTVLVFLCLLQACGPSPPEIATQTAAAWTSTPMPTSTLLPTLTPTATITATATITPTPTITPTLSPNTVTIKPGEPIHIGYLLAESMDFGFDSKHGVEVAIADMGGELLGHPIELSGYDTQCNQLAGERAAKLLLNEADLLGIIGTSCSAVANRALSVLASSGIVMISPSNTAPELTSPESHELIYLRTSPNDTVQAYAAAEFAINEFGAKTIATLSYTGLFYPTDLKDAACEEFTKLGGECVADRTINSGDTKLTAVLTKIAESDPDVLFVVLDADEAALVLSQSKEIPELAETTLIFTEMAFAPRLLELSGEDAVGAYITTTSFEFNQESVAYQTYLLSFQDNFGEQPGTQFHAFAYDAARMLLEAIEVVAVQQPDGTLIIDREAIRARLFVTEGFDGLTGSLTCSLTGDCASTSLTGRVYTIVSGDPTTWNPGVGLAANPDQVWPKP